MNEKNINVKLDVRVYPIGEPKGNTLAFANVGVEDLAAINGIRVVSGKNGLFVDMPQSKDKNGEFHDIAFPVNSDLRKELNKAVLAEYDSPTRDADGQNVGRSVAAPVKIEQGEKLSVKVYPIREPKSNTLAFANVGIENLLAISGIRVVTGKNGLFVDMPQSKDKNGEYHDIAFPINAELRKEVNKAVLGAYKEIAAENEKPIGERLDEGMREAANKAAEKAAQPAACKGKPGLGD
jgi:stage V sporulation protein G